MNKEHTMKIKEYVDNVVDEKIRASHEKMMRKIRYCNEKIEKSEDRLKKYIESNNEYTDDVLKEYKDKTLWKKIKGLF